METPHVSNRLVRLFTRYSRGYVRRHFHGVRLLKSHQLVADFRRLPAVVYLNHASWWDPLICLLLAAEYFPNRTSFAPIDAAALQKYRFLEKLGFFGIDPSSTRGAATFLRTAGNILESPERMLWVTPQGRFTDVRTRPVAFRGGLSALAGRVGPTVFLPMAIEYTFWEERLPEVLVAFGTPLFSQQHQNSCGVSDWNAALEATIQDAQDALADASQRRNPEEWEVLSRGASGTTAVYDLWRQARAAIRREGFNAEHSAL
jgi:1-acyl-sn-glycerol-3-phosphate acyltransferase